MQALKTKLLAQISALPLDSLTRQKLADKTTRYIQKNRLAELKTIDDLTSDVLQNKYSSITPLLRETHNNTYYNGHEYLRHFLRFEIPTWIEEDYINRMLLGKTVDGKYKNDNNISKLTFPRPVRSITHSVFELLQESELKFGKDGKETKADLDIEPIADLTIPPQSHIQEYEYYDHIVRHVFRLINFLSKDTIMHTKKIRVPMVYIPPNLLGDSIPEVRKKNIIKRHITYLRGALEEHPPLQTSDCEFLLNYTDDSQNFQMDDHWKGKNLRKEYRKFLRMSYTIDANGYCHYTKHAYVQPRIMNARLKEEVVL